MSDVSCQLQSAGVVHPRWKGFLVVLSHQVKGFSGIDHPNKMAQLRSIFSVQAASGTGPSRLARPVQEMGNRPLL